MSTDYNVNLNLRLNATGFQEGVTNANTALSSLNATLGRISRSFVSFLAIMAGRAVLQAFADSVKGAAELEYQLALVSRTSGITGTEITRLKNEMTALSISLGQPIEALSQLAIGAGRAGVKTVDEMMAIADTSSRMAMITGESADKISTYLLKISNAFKLPLTDVNHLASAVAVAGKETAATEEDIFKAMTRMAASGNMLGMTADQLVALAAIAVDSGVLATRAGTEWQSAFNKVIQQAGIAGPLIGQTADQFKKFATQDFNAALLAIAVALERDYKGVDKLSIATQLFGQQGLKVIGPFLTSLEKFGSVASKTTQAFRDGNYVFDASSALMDQVKIRIDSAKQAISTMGRAVGDELLPFVSDAAGALKEFATNAENISFLQTIFGNIAGILGDMAPLIREIGREFKMILAVANDIIAIIRIWANLLKTLVLEAIKYCLEKLSAIPDVLGGAKIREALANVNGELAKTKTISEELMSGDNFLTAGVVKENLQAIGLGFKQANDEYQKFAQSLMSGEGLQRGIDAATGFSPLGGVAGGGEDTTGLTSWMINPEQVATTQENAEVVKSVWTEMFNVLAASGSQFKTTQEAIGKTLANMWTQTASALVSSFGQAFAAVVSGTQSAGQAFASMWQSMTSVVLNLIGQIIAKLLIMLALMAMGRLITGGGWGFIGGAISQFATKGLWGMQEGGLVPGVGVGDKVPALLEPGELVIPKDKVGDVVNNNSSNVSVNVSMAGAMVMDDPKTVSRLYREHLRDVIRNDAWGARDKFYG